MRYPTTNDALQDLANRLGEPVEIGTDPNRLPPPGPHGYHIVLYQAMWLSFVLPHTKREELLAMIRGEQPWPPEFKAEYRTWQDAEQPLDVLVDTIDQYAVTERGRVPMYGHECVYNLEFQTIQPNDKSP